MRRKKSKLLLLAFLIAVLAAASGAVRAQDLGYRWSVTPYLGVHSASLEALNREALKAPTIGTGQVDTDVSDPEAENPVVSEPFGFSNPLDPIDREANAGLEFEWRQNAKDSLIIGASTWEGTSFGTTTGTLPAQGSFHDVIYQRRAYVSYNEFYVGWKRTFKSKPDKYRFYGRFSLNEFFDIDFRDEHVFTIQGGPLDDVKRIVAAKGQTTGVLMFQFGLGAEYFLKKNISIGFEASSLLSEQPFQFTSTSQDNNFPVGDQSSVFLPVSPEGEGLPLGSFPGNTDPNQNWAVPDEDGNVPAGSVPPPSWQEMKLRFDGWKAVLRVTIYY